MKNDIRGIASIFLAATIYGFIGVLSRLIGFDLPIFFQQLVRYLLSIIILLIIIWRTESWKQIQKKDWGWILLRGISGLVSFLGVYVAFLYIDFSTVYFVSYASATIGGYILGKLLFKEKFTLVRIFSLIIALIGLYMTYPAHLSKFENLFVLILLIAGFATSGWTVISRKISENYSLLQTVILDYMVGIIFLIGLSVLNRETWIIPSFNSEWYYLGLLLIAQIITSFLIAYGFNRVDVHIGTLILLFDIIVGVTLGAMFFKEYPGFITVIGGGLIVISIMIPNIFALWGKNAGNS